MHFSPSTQMIAKCIAGSTKCNESVTSTQCAGTRHLLGIENKKCNMHAHCTRRYIFSLTSVSLRCLCLLCFFGQKELAAICHNHLASLADETTSPRTFQFTRKWNCVCPQFTDGEIGGRRRMERHPKRAS